MNILLRSGLVIFSLPLWSSHASASSWAGHGEPGWKTHYSTGLVIDKGALFTGLAQNGLHVRSRISIAGNYVGMSPYSVQFTATHGDDGTRLFPGFGVETFQLQEVSLSRAGEYFDIKVGRTRLFHTIPGGILDGGRIELREIPSQPNGLRLPLDISFGWGRAGNVGNKLKYDIWGGELSLPYSNRIRPGFAVWKQEFSELNLGITWGKGVITVDIIPSRLSINSEIIYRRHVAGPVKSSVTLRAKGPLDVEGLARIIKEKPESRPITNEFNFAFQAFQQEDLAFRINKKLYNGLIGLERRRYDRILIGTVVIPADLAAEDLKIEAGINPWKLRLKIGSKFYRYKIKDSVGLSPESLVSRVPKMEVWLNVSLKLPFVTLILTQTIYRDLQGQDSQRSSLKFVR